LIIDTNACKEQREDVQIIDVTSYCLIDLFTKAGWHLRWV